MRETLAVAVLVLGAPLAACGTQHPVGAPHPAHSTHAVAASPAASSAAGPFASWSPVCQRVASDMEDVGYSYTGNGNWSITGTITYGQMQKLASKFAHLSYVEMQGPSGNGDSQTANDLADASTGFFKYLPSAAYNNSEYHHVMHETASSAALNGWDQQYLVPVMNDCASGGG